MQGPQGEGQFPPRQMEAFGMPGQGGQVGNMRNPPPCQSPEECKKLEDVCRTNPENCQRLQQNGNINPGEFVNMSEEEREKRMNEIRTQSGDMQRPMQESKPYRPEGLLPMEAFKRDPSQGTAPMPPRPGPNATQEQLRIYQMNMENYNQFQNMPAGDMRQPGTYPMGPENYPQGAPSGMPGYYPPPGDMPQGGTYSPPPGSGDAPPPPPPAPQSSLTFGSYLASVFVAFSALLEGL